MRFLAFSLLSILFFSSLLMVQGDLYMHNPRGSRNRLNERNAQANNGNRLFNSQDNNRGGYNVGERGQLASIADDGTDASNTPLSPLPIDYAYNPKASASGAITDASRAEFSAQYQMVYLEGSKLTVDWTNQHACGGNEANDPQKANCDLVFQYACETAMTQPTTHTDITDFTTQASSGMYLFGTDDGLVDGTNTNSPQNGGDGRHESTAYFDTCNTRVRNYYLFLGDQNMNGATSQFTRQNSGGDKSGYECQEERDYWPYWAPVPWVDVALLTDHPEAKCTNGLYNGDTQNLAYSGGTSSIRGFCNAKVSYGGQNLYPWQYSDCQAGSWINWPIPNAGIGAPECLPAPWSRDDHLGAGRDGYHLTYNWTLPTIAQLTALGAKVSSPTNSNPSNMDNTGSSQVDSSFVKCIFRLRYNVSTDDYDPTINFCYNNNQQQNGNLPACTNAPAPLFTPQPQTPNGNNNNGEYYVTIGGAGMDYTNRQKYPVTPGNLRLQLNNNQMGRVFQDRSHTFYIKSRPAIWANPWLNIYNLNVLGKRCNIVECYPAVQYDFIPQHLSIVSDSDLVHVQWTGSNSHQNQGNGGDGQTGDTGQGTDGTDRHNMAQILDLGLNYPMPLDVYTDNMWSHSNCYSPFGNNVAGSSLNGYAATLTDVGNIATNENQLDCAIQLTTSGYWTNLADVQTAAAAGIRMSPLLNPTNGNTQNDQGSPNTFNPPASLIGGVVMRFHAPASQNLTYYYVDTRNNAFSNRGVKGLLSVYHPGP